jgi:hypothetical protein
VVLAGEVAKGISIAGEVVRSESDVGRLGMGLQPVGVRACASELSSV